MSTRLRLAGESVVTTVRSVKRVHMSAVGDVIVERGVWCLDCAHACTSQRELVCEAAIVRNEARCCCGEHAREVFAEITGRVREVRMS